MPTTFLGARVRIATGACLLAIACRAPGLVEEPALDVFGSPAAAGTYAGAGEHGRYRIELSAEGAFRFLVCDDGLRECAVWGRWFVNEGSLGGLGLRLMPHVPGVEPWSKGVLCLWATPDDRPAELLFDWVHDHSDWVAFQPGQRVRFVRVAD